MRLGTLLAAVAGLWSCVAPILTVPPPGAVTFTPAFVASVGGAQSQFWTTEGGPLEQAAGAAYFVMNKRLASGVIATAQPDGSFKAPPLEGNENDEIRIYYRTMTGDYSEPACFSLVEGTSPELAACSP
ncbi:MAG TPA: hypothetical protein VHO67_02470 [Polyangia bacterium]|nr:hypothetical protein [Polyangia bacterium]